MITDSESTGSSAIPTPKKRRLNEIEGVDEAIDMEKLPPNYLKKSKKRKTAQSPSILSGKDVQAVDLRIPVDSALLSIVKALANTTLSMLQLLTTFTFSTADKVAEITSQEETLIIEMRSMCFKAVTSQSPALPMNAVVGIVMSLQKTSTLMLPLFPLMPDAVRQQVLEQEKLLSELRSHCIMAVDSQAKARETEQSGVYSSTGQHTTASGS
uniref:Uncharacterized protein n=1 Tax=Arundo donax TaxID=35708 RepID=A0A0A8Y6S1_ARUDO